MVKISYYRFAFLAGLLIATMIVIGVNLSDFATPYAAFVGDKIFIVWGMVFFEWLVHHTTGISIFPFGSHDPDTYILQHYLGYEGAIVFAIVGGLILASLFSWSVATYGITWMPVSRMLAPGWNVASKFAITFFSGGDPALRAFIDGFVPTFFENPLLIYSTVFLIWIIPRYILSKVFGVPDVAANITGLIIWLLFSGIIFSYAYHAFAYQAVEPAYTRAYIFVVANGVLVGTTGIPFPMDASHFGNNYAASYFNIVSWGATIMLVPILVTRIGNGNFKFGKYKFKRYGKGVASIIIALIIVGGIVGGYSLYRMYQNQPVIPESISRLPYALRGLSIGKSFSIVDSCRLIQPTWGYYECSKSANPITPVSDSVSVSGLWKENSKTFSCDKSDVDPLGIQTPYWESRACRVKATQISGPSDPKFSCSQTRCRGGTESSGYVNLNDVFYLKFGESITFTVSGPIIGTSSIVWQSDWYQKTLHKKTWTGYKTSEYPGCDENTVRMMSSKENDLIAQGKVTSLNIGNRINFIDTYIDVPIIGNYWNHPRYGEVVCSNNRLYKLERYSIANEQGQEGKFVDSNNACYYIMGSNWVDSCDCSPGMTMGSMTCSNEGKWVSLDKGVCVRGGISNVQLCPGAGQDVVDLSKGTVTRYTCNANTGNCDAQIIKTGITCDPATQRGCAGDEFCNANYQCQQKPTTRIACPYDWCNGDPNYLDKDCPSGLQPCQTISSTAGACLENCKGIEPPVTTTTTMPPSTDEGRCYANCNAKKHFLDPIGISTWWCKAKCWWDYHSLRIIVGVIILVLMTLLGGEIGAVIGLVLMLAMLFV